MHGFSYSHPVQLHFGIGMVANAPELVCHFGSRVVLCIDAFVANTHYAESLRTRLKEHGCVLHREIVVAGEPETSGIDAEVEATSGAEAVVAMGGGSTIDFAKALTVGAANGASAWEYSNAAGGTAQRDMAPCLPLVVIPTTAGSGSEMTAIAVISNRKAHLKSTIVSPALYPKIAVVDPQLSMSVPPKIRTMVALDALAHGFENYLNVTTVCEVNRFVGSEAVRRIAPKLQELHSDTVSQEAFIEVALGSSLAGWSNALGTTGSAHAIAQSFGAAFGLPHCAAVAVVVPAILERTWPAIPEVFCSAAGAFGVEQSGSIEQQCRGIVNWWRRTEGFRQARKKLAGLTFAAHDVTRLADGIVQTMQRPLKRHPVFFGSKDIQDIIAAVLSSSTEMEA